MKKQSYHQYKKNFTTFFIDEHMNERIRGKLRRWIKDILINTYHKYYKAEIDKKEFQKLINKTSNKIMETILPNIINDNLLLNYLREAFPEEEPEDIYQQIIVDESKKNILDVFKPQIDSEIETIKYFYTNKLSRNPKKNVDKNTPLEKNDYGILTYVFKNLEKEGKPNINKAIRSYKNSIKINQDIPNEMREEIINSIGQDPRRRFYVECKKRKIDHKTINSVKEALTRNKPTK